MTRFNLSPSCVVHVAHVLSMHLGHDPYAVFDCIMLDAAQLVTRSDITRSNMAMSRGSGYLLIAYPNPSENDLWDIAIWLDPAVGTKARKSEKHLAWDAYRIRANADDLMLKTAVTEEKTIDSILDIDGDH